MGLFSKGKAPQFDAAAAIGAQTTANNNAYSASAKAAGKSGPFGSSQYKFDANGMPIGQESSFSGPLNNASNNLQGNLATMSGLLPQTAFSLNDVPSGMDVAGATFKQGMNYMDPIFKQQQKENEIRNFNRGLPINSEIEGANSGAVYDSQNRAMNDLTQRSILVGNDERRKMIGDKLTERNQVGVDMGRSLGLLGGLGGLLPQAGNIGNVAAPDAMGAYKNQYESQTKAYADKNAMYGQLAQLGLGLAAAPFTGGTSLIGAGAGALGGMLKGGGGGGGSYGSPSTGYEVYTPAGWGA